MRLVIDLQGAQSSSHERGIGRYSRDLATAMSRLPRNHEVIIVLSGAFPDTAEQLVERFSKILSRQQIKLWHPPSEISFLANSPRRALAETLRAQFLASLRPDLVHVASLFEGLGDDVVTRWPLALERLPVVATCYDLIPLIRRDHYFGPNGVISMGQKWYYSCLQEISLSTGLLAISESSRNEVIRHLGYSADRVFNIRAGIDKNFKPVRLDTAEHAALLRRYGLKDEFILFLGAGDIRKNEAGLINAYALLPPNLRARYQLLVVGKMNPERLHEVASQRGLQEDRLVISAFVEEGDLSALYSACALFVFPSMHEGFGLPVAEAMACGAPVIASNTTSLPEVMGRLDVLFDPTQPTEIAARMQAVLEDPNLRRSLVEHGIRQAAEFTWEFSAKRAWDALEQLHRLKREKECNVTRRTVLRPKPTLAFVSPLPPQASGISDYSRDLVPYLAKHYNITLVTEVTSLDDVRLQSSFPLLCPQDFDAVAHCFDRILYQIGNSELHRFQLQDLLPSWPGVVVLHDAFLSDVYNAFAHRRGQPDSFHTDLFRSHGYFALETDEILGRDVAVQSFPCCLPVLEDAIGVIQHSEHGRDVLTTHFGGLVESKTSVIPLLRASRPRPIRAIARARLGVREDEFLICSFGIVAPKKMPDTLIRAWRMMQDPGSVLVFVGLVADDALFLFRNGDGEDYENHRPRITGRVDQETYDLWLAAADIAVQLRTMSRGETSAAIGDCFSAGVPVIVNAHGSADEIPENCAIKLSDPFEDTDLADALVMLRDEPPRREALQRAALVYAREVLGAEAIAARYYEVIEDAYASSPAAAVASLASTDLTILGTSPAALTTVSRSCAQTFKKPLVRKLFLDMSAWSRTGPLSSPRRAIQEVCRRLLRRRANDVRVETVHFAGENLRYAPLIASELLGGSFSLPDAHPIDVSEGDIFLCMMPYPSMTNTEFQEIKLLRLRGARIITMVHDLLPMRRPELLPGAALQLTDWYSRVLAIADNAVCWSSSMVEELKVWLNQKNIVRDTPLQISCLLPGFDYTDPRGIKDFGMAEADYMAAVASASRRRTVLMTGPIERWGGFDEVLESFESLWIGEQDFGLIILGEAGWQMTHFTKRLHSHPEFGIRLHWLPSLGEAERRRLYCVCASLLVASENELDSLWIEEAAWAGLPVIARDLPAFRKVGGPAAIYFSNFDVKELAFLIKKWLNEGGKEHQQSQKGEARSWDESIVHLLGVVLGGL